MKNKIYLGYVTAFFGFLGIFAVFAIPSLILHQMFEINLWVKSTSSRIPVVIVFIASMLFFIVADKCKDAHYDDFNRMWKTTAKEKHVIIYTTVFFVLVACIIKILNGNGVEPFVDHVRGATTIIRAPLVAFVVGCAICLTMAYFHSKRLYFAIKYDYDSFRDISELMEKHPESLKYVKEDIRKRYGYKNITTVQ